MKKTVRHLFGLLLATAICAPAAAKDLSKDLTKANADLVGGRINNDKKKLAKGEAKINEIINAKGEESGVAKKFLAEHYYFTSPKEFQKPEECYKLICEAEKEISDDYTPYKLAAMVMRGKCHAYGYGVPQNLDSAFYFFDKLAKIDFKESASLSEMYLFGFGTKQDLKTALEISFSLAKDGNMSMYAQMYLCMYLMDHIEKGDLNREAFENYKNALLLFTTDKEKSIELIKRAADAGFIPAQYDYGTWHLNGQIYPRTKNFALDPRSQEEAEKYLKMAADAGYPIAMNNYASLMEQKDAKRMGAMIIKRDEKNALIAGEYLKKSADTGFPLAQCNVCNWHTLAVGGFERDYGAGYEYALAASLQGCKLGNAYINGMRNMIKQGKANTLTMAVFSKQEKLMQAKEADYDNVVEECLANRHGFFNTVSEHLQKASDANSTVDAVQATEVSVEMVGKRNKDVKLYANMVKKVKGMKESGNVDAGSLSQLQENMKNIREKWAALDLWPSGTSEWETWNGK